jgi:hypothetical protein
VHGFSTSDNTMPDVDTPEDEAKEVWNSLLCGSGRWNKPIGWEAALFLVAGIGRFMAGGASDPSFGFDSPPQAPAKKSRANEHATAMNGTRELTSG